VPSSSDILGSRSSTLLSVQRLMTVSSADLSPSSTVTMQSSITSCDLMVSAVASTMQSVCGECDASDDGCVTSSSIAQDVTATLPSAGNCDDADRKAYVYSVFLHQHSLFAPVVRPPAECHHFGSFASQPSIAYSGTALSATGSMLSVAPFGNTSDVVSVSTSRSRDVVYKHLGLVETWEGLDLVSDRKSNVSVSYHRVSFTSQYAQLFASLQNCTYIVLNARRIFIVALWNRADHYIFHPVSIFSFFLA